MHDQGVNMRVTANSNQGHRKYMEDCYKIRFHREEKQADSTQQQQQPEQQQQENNTTTDQSNDILFSYFAIFDGHGGKEAAQYAKENLYWKIIESDDFWSDDDNRVLKAINDGFIKCHLDMWKYELSKWPKTSSGLPSTSGCTATVLFIKKTKAYVGHVGDSGLVIGFGDSYHAQWTGRKLTRDHKPEDPIELERIENCGGEVMSKGGVNRVVWNRPVINQQNTASTVNLRRQRQQEQQQQSQDPSSQPTEKVPFLAVARSLGDLWSYNYKQDEFIVSPIPDVFTFEINPNIHRCIVLATDGLWNVMRASETVEIARQTDIETENLILRSESNKSETPPFVNPSQRLVNIGIQRCCEKMLRADNTTCITIMLDKPGLSFSENVLQNGTQNRHALSSSGQTDAPSTPTSNMNKYNESFVFKSSKSLVSLRRRHWSGGTNVSEKQRSSKRLKNFNKSVTSTTIGAATTHIKKKLFNSSLTCNLERKHHKYDYNHNKTFSNKDENANDIAGEEDLGAGDDVVDDDIEKEEIKITTNKSFKISQTPKYKRRLRLIKERLLKTKNNLLNKKSNKKSSPTSKNKTNNKHDQTLNQSLMFNFRHKFSLKRRTNDVCDEELQKSIKKTKLN